jgi:hypothetical protein
VWKTAMDYENYSCKKNRVLICNSLGMKEYSSKEDILSKLSIIATNEQNLMHYFNNRVVQVKRREKVYKI